MQTEYLTKSNFNTETSQGTARLSSMQFKPGQPLETEHFQLDKIDIRVDAESFSGEQAFIGGIQRITFEPGPIQMNSISTI